MIEGLLNKIWYGEGVKASLLRLGVSPLLLPLTLFYFALQKIDKKKALASSVEVFAHNGSKVPVVVVGNLTAGGSGKTPLVLAIAEFLHKRGQRVAVVSRGYGSGISKACVLPAAAPAEEFGDEPAMLRFRLPQDIPVAVAAKRVDAVKAVLAIGEVDIVLADDGLQHYALKRDIEVIAVHKKRGLGNGWVLPFGPLREPLSSALPRDNALFIQTHSDQKELAVSSEIDSLVNEKVFASLFAALEFVQVGSGNVCSLDEARQQLQNASWMTGIADPDGFFDTLSQLGLNAKSKKCYADHYAFTANDFPQPDELLIMTEKDAVKCQGFGLSNAWYLKGEAQIADAFWQEFENKVEHIL